MIYQTLVFPGQTIVKKNSQRVVRFGNHSSIRPSAAYDKWEKATMLNITVTHREAILDYPVYIHYKFYRKDRRKFDLSNMCEGINDLMQKCGVIVDDDFRHVFPVFHSEHGGVMLDKDNPRAIVTITDKNYKLKGGQYYE